MSQLPLPLHLDDHAVFDSFLAAGNETAVSFLGDTNALSPGCWLWGAASVGKTHLLQAVCAQAGEKSQYVPCREMLETEPGVFGSLAGLSIVCLDDVDALAGIEEWEFALFALFNALIDGGGALLCAASTTPRDAAIKLPDLASRFTRLTVFRLHELEEPARSKALQLRARHRGLELPDETAKYLLNRSRRDMRSLYELLDRLDREALVAQRRLTVPFVREVLSVSSST